MLLLPLLLGDTADTAAIAAVLRMEKTYAQMPSYRDNGTATMTFTGPLAPDTTITLAFSTVFQRPSKLRIDFEQKKSFGADQSKAKQELERELQLLGVSAGERAVAWSNGKGVWTWSSWSGASASHRSIDYALASLSDFSTGVSQCIPKMLLPRGVSSLGLSEIGDWRSAGTEKVAGRTCLKVTSKLRRQTLWLDKSGSLLLKSSFVTDVAEGVTGHHVVSYVPATKPRIASSAFTFAPPRKI